MASVSVGGLAEKSEDSRILGRGDGGVVREGGTVDGALNCVSGGGCTSSPPFASQFHVSGLGGRSWESLSFSTPSVMKSSVWDLDLMITT